MGERTTWLLQGGHELFIIYLLHNQLIEEEVKRQARRQTQCRTVSREGPGFPIPLAWVWALLTFDHGCVWCSGNSHYFKQKLKATHWENGLWRFRKAAQFPWAAPGKAPSQFHLLFAENFRRHPFIRATHPPHPTWKRSLFTFLSVLRALLSLKYLPGVKQLEVKHLLEIWPWATPHPFLQWGGQSRVTPKVTLGSSSQLRLGLWPHLLWKRSQTSGSREWGLFICHPHFPHSKP